MAINNSNLSLTFSHRSTDWEKQPFTSYWKKHFLYNFKFGLDEENIKIVACRALGVLAASLAGAFYALKAIGIITAISSYIIPAFILISSLSFWQAWRLERQTQCLAMDSLRKEVKKLTLDEIVRHYSWKDLFTLELLSPDEFTYAYHKQMKELTLLEICAYYEKVISHLEDCKKAKYIYYVPLPSTFRNKWDKETANKTFEDIIKFYPIEKLKQYNLLSSDELHILQTLELVYKEALSQKAMRIKEIDQNFPDLLLYQEKLDVMHKKIEQNYQQNPAINNLSRMGFEYTSKYARIRNKLMHKKQKAFATCDQFLQRHPTDRKKWSKSDVDAYDALHQHYLFKVDEMEKIARKELEAIKHMCFEKHTRLQNEIACADEQHQLLKSKADQQYDQFLSSQNQRRQELLDPINRRFQGIVDNLNRQYAIRRNLVRT